MHFDHRNDFSGNSHLWLPRLSCFACWCPLPSVWLVHDIGASNRLPNGVSDRGYWLAPIRYARADYTCEMWWVLTLQWLAQLITLTSDLHGNPVLIMGDLPLKLGGVPSRGTLLYGVMVVPLSRIFSPLCGVMVFPLSRGFSPLSGVRVLPPVVAFLHYGVLWYFPFMLAFLHCVVWRYIPSVVAFLHYVVLWYFPSVVAFLQNVVFWYFPSVVAFLHHVMLRYFPFMCDGSFPFPVWQHSLIEKNPKNSALL